MKNIFLGLLIGLVVMTSVLSCKKANFLDQTATETLNQAKVFADSTQTMNFLNNIYAYSGQDIVPMRYVLIAAAAITGQNVNDYACLEDLTTQSASYYSQPQLNFITGASTSSNAPFNNYYANYYARIRNANMFMKLVKTSPLSQPLQTRTIAEARFLRAWYYSQLVRLYGGVIIVGDTVFNVTDQIPAKRNTFKQCIDYIAGQCDTASLDLPSAVTQSATDYGRITSGACLALKARMLLTAASPLYNGSAISNDAVTGPLVSYSSSFDASLWQKAADAFQAVMNLGIYSLYVDNSVPGNGFRNVFLMRQNSEYIFPYMIAPGNDLESDRFPYTRSSNGGFSTPSQNLVDAFGMNNGALISDPNSGYDPNNPYSNRDPRFYHSIIFNQARVYYSSTQRMDPVNIYGTISSSGVYTPTADGLQQYRTKTGYYSSKMANDSVSVSTTENRVYPLIRYAEILLGYAEAVNEAQGPTAAVYNALQQIRMRAGILPGADNSYGLPAGLSQTDMRRIIQNEYNVELSYEGHRFYDVRRWRIAEVTENTPIQGMKITLAGGSYSYARTPVILSSFITPKMYFQPIPVAETGKSLDMVQNPGW